MVVDRMSELPRHLPPSFPESPLDYAITQCNETILPLVHMTGHIPNIITTYSFLCGMVCVWALQQSHFLLFMMTFVLQYVFDCMDGHFARTYAMTSQVGDLYDHITDMVFHALLLVVVVKRHYQTPGRWWVLGVLLLGSFMRGQQQCYANHNETGRLDTFQVLYPNAVPRWFGPATFQCALLACILLLECLWGRVVAVFGRPQCSLRQKKIKPPVHGNNPWRNNF